MKILVLEDRPYTLKNITEALAQEGHDVIACNSIYVATERYSENKDSLDYIIADLSLSSSGLSTDEKANSEGGLFSGWIWLRNYVLNNNKAVHCIIFSGYLDLFKEYIYSTNNVSLLDNITLINKGGFDSLEILARTIEKLKPSSDIKSKVKKRTVFLSYCNSDSDIADIVEKALYNHFSDRISVSRYTRDVKYRDSIKAFMKTIKDHDFVVSIISSSYLKSRACMYEIGELFNVPDFKAKLLFILLSDDDKQYYKTPPVESIAANIYNPISQSNYVLFWKDMYEKLIDCRRLLGDYIVNSSLDDAIFETKKILDNDIQQFLVYLSDACGVPFSVLVNNNFQDIISAIENGCN
jgi:hypothetical protein